jgi:ankyrin repeat protein
MDKKILDRKLIHAIKDNNYDLVESLIKIGADVNTRVYDDPPLFHAIYMEAQTNKNRKKSIVDLLLESKADMYQRIRSKFNIVDYVIYTDKRDAFKKLIFYGADLNKTHTLLFAVFKDHLHIVRILLNNDVDITARDRYGNNAIMLATELDKPNALDIIKDICMVASINDIDIINNTNKDGDTALDLGSNKEIKKFLISQGAKSLKKITDKTCNICIYNKINIIIEPCKHGICNECLPKVNRCPFCRGEILMKT